MATCLERVRDVGWRKMTKQIIRVRMRANVCVCVCVEEGGGGGKVLLSISTRAAAEETNRKCSWSMIYQTRPLILSCSSIYSTSSNRRQDTDQ